MERGLSKDLPVEQPGARTLAAQSRGILLLDDDSASLRLMQGVLRTAGYECIATDLPEEAIAIVAGNRDIRVVVSDICMPDIDGLMFLDRLNLLSGPPPSVLFLTGHPSLDHAVSALRMGAVDFLTKPLRPRELLDAVDRAFERAAQIAANYQGGGAVESLAQQAEELATRLRALMPPAAPAVESNVIATHAALSSTKIDLVANDDRRRRRTAQLLDTIEQLRRLRRRYHAVLGEMDDVAWELLMEVLRSDREKKQISVSGLSISIEGVSSTTALRRIGELVARGHLHRIPDPSDARRDFIELNPQTREAVEGYLAQAAEYLG